MTRILLGATGSVAAIRIPDLHRELTQAGFEVRIVATNAATYFFDVKPLRDIVTLDEDEWAGRDQGRLYQRGDVVPHIELRNWADLFVIAPLDANTLAKLAVGLCDNCLTCVWRAWDRSKPVILAPAMNTLMWENPFTIRHLSAIAADFGAHGTFRGLDSDFMIRSLNESAAGIHIVPPIEKTLACGDTGLGAMAEVQHILAAIESKRVSQP